MNSSPPPFSFRILLLLSIGCSDVGSMNSVEDGCSGSCFNSETKSNGGTSDSSASANDEVPHEVVRAVNPLCGVPNCDPDDLKATRCNSVTQTGKGAGGSDGSDRRTHDAGDADADTYLDGDAGNADTSTDAEEPGDDAETNGGGMGGAKSAWDDNSPIPPIPPPDDSPNDENDSPDLACQVRTDGDGRRMAICVPAGSGVDKDPCVTSADCAAGYACVGDSAGACRRYCCLDAEACPALSYCGELPSRDPTQQYPSAPLKLPVCVPAEPCELLPGPTGNNGCTEGLMCTIVRADGTTACVLPGTAREGEPCESVNPGHSACAEGFVCSRATNTCLALCDINAPDSCDDGGVCQAGANSIPGSYGVCIGARD